MNFHWSLITVKRKDLLGTHEKYLLWSLSRMKRMFELSVFGEHEVITILIKTVVYYSSAKNILIQVPPVIFDLLIGMR